MMLRSRSSALGGGLRPWGGADTDREPFFHAWRRGTDVRTEGEDAKMLGHQIATGDHARKDGVFAEWAWDGEELVVSNDRYGFYPLYYSISDNEVAVSPSILQLVERGVSTELDDAALSVFLRLGYFVGEDTPFAMIRALPPNATLRWKLGNCTVQGSYAIPKAARFSVDEATEVYGQLFRNAIGRRAPRDGPFVHPLSGGRDSRHILFELVEHGWRPNVCVTAQHYPTRTKEDARIARLVAHELGLRHVVVKQPSELLEAEIRKNIRTSLCTDEHTWYLPVAEFLSSRTNTVYDGIGGVFCTTLREASPRLADDLDLFRHEHYSTIAERLCGDAGEAAHGVLFDRGFASRTDRTIAVQRLVRELERHREAPNPLKSFFFWNRTRREIALQPYRVLESGPLVYSPFVDHDLYDFLASLPGEVFGNMDLHSETIRRTYPQWAHLPYEDKRCRPVNPSEYYAAYSRQLAAFVWRRGMVRSKLLRNEFLFPRLIRACLSPTYAGTLGWMAPHALYFIMLEMVAEGELLRSGGGRS
jgi:hypothetical protein